MFSRAYLQSCRSSVSGLIHVEGKIEFLSHIPWLLRLRNRDFSNIPELVFHSNFLWSMYGVHSLLSNVVVRVSPRPDISGTNLSVAFSAVSPSYTFWFKKNSVYCVFKYIRTTILETKAELFVTAIVSFSMH